MPVTPMPGAPFPALDLPRAGGGRFKLHELLAPNFTILNVYRGLHCPRCKKQLQGMIAERATFDAMESVVLSISTDPGDRAEQALADWDLGDMPVGHSLTVEQARALGLYISTSIREGETDVFAEPGVFLIRPDGTLWGAVIGSFPFLRPTADMLIDAMTVARDRNYPPRGTLAA